MKIAIVHPYFHIRGGAEKVAAAAILSLCDKFHVDVITCDSEVTVRAALVELEPQLAEKTFSVRAIKSKSLSFALPVLVAYSLLVRQLRRIVPEYDVTFSTYGELPPMGASRAYCYIHYPVFPLSLKAASRIGGRLRLPILRLAYVWICRRIAGFSGIDRAATLIANSNWTKEQTREYYDNVISVVYPPVEPFLNSERNFDNLERRRLVCLGRLVAYKGHKTIIEAALKANINSKGRFLVDFIGRGTESTAKHIGMINPMVDCEVHTNLSRDQIREKIQHVGVGVSAFSHEHFGIAVAELSLSGIPTFVPPGGGQVEIVADQYLIYATEDELAKKLVEMSINDDLYRNLSKKAWRSRERFSKVSFARNLDLALNLGVCGAESSDNI